MCALHSQCSYQGLRHFDMYTACRRIVVVKGSPFLFSSPYASMHRTDLHIKKEILYQMIRDKMCLYSTSSAPMELCLQSSKTTSRGFIKLTDSPPTAE